MIDPADLKVEAWPPRDKGGQHVGTVTGVSVTHIPTGITATVNTDRSQFRNREIAMDMILTALTHPRFR